uniref:Protein kinase domain-containing protein n=1 Tax=Sexangularia sp. CB-2014 TaxID=1486929 RepID=A0A7S1Y7W1_9EUKA
MPVDLTTISKPSGLKGIGKNKLEKETMDVLCQLARRVDDIEFKPTMTKDEVVKAILKWKRSAEQSAGNKEMDDAEVAEDADDGEVPVRVVVFRGGKQDHNPLDGKRHMRKRWPKEVRSRVYRRTDGFCYLCKKPIPPESSWHIEHVIAFSDNPVQNDVKGNLLPAHAKCNLTKSDKNLVDLMSLGEFSLDTNIALNPGDSLQPNVKRIILHALAAKRAERGQALEEELLALLEENAAQESRNKLPELAFVEFDFGKVKVIGKGSQGTVARAEWSERGVPVAVKCIDQKEHGALHVIAQLDHANLVHVYGLLEDEKASLKKPLYLVMELMTGDLYELRGKARFLKQSRANTLQILGALKYLHEKEIMHRDLKPRNVLWKAGDRGKDDTVIKIADYGLVKEGVDDGHEGTVVGTIVYRAPEVRNGKYGVSADVYSFGKTMIELKPNTVSDSFMDDMKSTWEKCCANAPQDRPTASQLFADAVKMDERKMAEQSQPTPVVDDTAAAEQEETLWRDSESNIFHAVRLCHGAAIPVTMADAQKMEPCKDCGAGSEKGAVMVWVVQDSRGRYHTRKGHYKAKVSVQLCKAQEEGRVACTSCASGI